MDNYEDNVLKSPFENRVGKKLKKKPVKKNVS